MFLRSIHPKFFVDGVVLGIGFRPTEADEGLLSGYDRNLASPEEAFVHRTEAMKKQSAGIWGVEFAEIASLNLPLAHSPSEGAPAHMHVDFTRLEKKTCKERAQSLADMASERGCLYPTGHAEQMDLPTIDQ
jgi:hypothetical protein